MYTCHGANVGTEGGFVFSYVILLTLPTELITGTFKLLLLEITFMLLNICILNQYAMEGIILKTTTHYK